MSKSTELEINKSILLDISVSEFLLLNKNVEFGIDLGFQDSSLILNYNDKIFSGFELNNLLKKINKNLLSNKAYLNYFLIKNEIEMFELCSGRPFNLKFLNDRLFSQEINVIAHTKFNPEWLL